MNTSLPPVLPKNTKLRDSRVKSHVSKLFAQFVQSVVNDDGETFKQQLDGVAAAGFNIEINLLIQTSPGSDSATFLELAVSHNAVKCVKVILSFSDVDVNCPAKDGLTPLMQAVKNGHVEIVRLLLGHSLISVNQRHALSEKTALAIAADESQAECVLLIVQHVQMSGGSLHLGDPMSSEAMRCVICLAAPVARAMVPCGHCCVCITCPVLSNDYSGMPQCPICRVYIDQDMKLFFP